MPARPSAAETGPSCMTPSPESSGSSSCRAMTPPQSRWYWRARRRMRALGDRQPVVAEADRAGVAQLRHLGQLLAPHAAGDRGEEADRDRGLGARALAQRLDVGRGGDGRVGVGHREDAAVAAGGGGARPGLDVLLVLLAGGAQVDVRVEEGGEGVQALGVDHLGALRVGGARARPARRSGRRGSTTSWGASIPATGSSTVAPRRTRFAPSPERMSSASARLTPAVLSGSARVARRRSPSAGAGRSRPASSS